MNRKELMQEIKPLRLPPHLSPLPIIYGEKNNYAPFEYERQALMIK